VHVAVTGSSGKIGHSAVAALAAAGHGVTGFDLRPSPNDAPTVPVDCTDRGQVMDALTGTDPFRTRPDALVHLAGIPAPGLAHDAVTFTANTTAVYNVFTACARLGINRIAWAFSETILGLPFTTPPDFLPPDETHPDRPEWSYALSEQPVETMADAFTRWNPGLATTSLRFSNVLTGDDYPGISPLQAAPAHRKANAWAHVDA